MQIGVDVGGTNTDGVIMSDGKVLVSDKTVTTQNVGDGVFNVIKSVLNKGNISADKITSVMIGTTHFTNALVERKRLQKIAAIRLCLPASDSLVQMIGWPEDLISTLEKRPKAMDVILTGPTIPSQVISMADQVTELRCGH